MPYKLFAYWSAPKAEDVEAFEEYYASTHVPRAAAAGSDAWAEMRQCSGDIIERFGVSLTVEMGEEVTGTPSA